MKAICDFFEVSDSTKLTWAHRVNDRQYLEECVTDDTLMILEGDVYFEEGLDAPFMANPDQDISNLLFEEWVSVASLNQKGLKIDVQTPASLKPMLRELSELNIQTPVILHAEIFNLLSDDADAECFEPEQFIRLCQQYAPKATISLGWSLKRTADEDGRMEDILISQVTELMFSKLGGLNYTIEIRGGYTPNWERGAALIFEPILDVPKPNFTGNVIDGTDFFKATPKAVANSES